MFENTPANQKLIENLVKKLENLTEAEFWDLVQNTSVGRKWVFEGECGFDAKGYDIDTDEPYCDATRGDQFYHKISNEPMVGGQEMVSAEAYRLLEARIEALEERCRYTAKFLDNMQDHIGSVICERWGNALREHEMRLIGVWNQDLTDSPEDVSK
jgi:hypothetical protein